MAPLRPPRTIWRRALNYLLVFATVVLLADALVGERGLVASVRARQQSHGLEASVAQLKHENARLREFADRLKADPTTIESVAREKHGFVRAGELLVVVTDVKPATK